MTPEAKLVAFANRIYLQGEEEDYLLSLLQEARGLGSLAGAAAEREACAGMLDDEDGRLHRVLAVVETPGDETVGKIEVVQRMAAAIRARGETCPRK